MLSCPEHGCRLEADHDIELAAARAEPVPHRPAAEHILALELLTWEGLTRGVVVLPRRTVHVGVWLRLLRALLDEISLSTSSVRKHSAAALDLIWKTVSQQPRAGLAVWRPYEALGRERQETMLEAAAIALDLTRTGKISARGSFGLLLTSQPKQPVYDGDRPDPVDDTDRSHQSEVARAIKHELMTRSWAGTQQALEEWFSAARTEPAVARQICRPYSYAQR